MALAANPDARRAREKITELRHQIRAVRSRALPKLDLTLSLSHIHDPGLQNSPNFSGGGDFLPPSLFGAIEYDNYAYRFDLEQPILSFGRVSHALGAAREEMAGVREDVRAVERRVARDAALAYYDLLLARERLRVLESERVARARQLDGVKARFELEDATRLNLLTAQVALANLQPRILAAESGVRVAAARLNEILGRPVTAGIEPADAFALPDPLPAVPSVETLIELADRGRPELKRFTLNRRVLREAQGVTRADVLPEITGNASFGVSTFERGNLTDLDLRSWSLGVTLRWRFFDGMQAAGTIAQYKSQARQSELQEASFRADMTRELERAAGDWRRGLEAVRAAQAAVEQAREAESLAEESFKWGAATILDILEAERGMRQAELNHAEACHVALTAIAELKYLIGLRADARIDAGEATETDAGITEDKQS